MIRNNRFAWLAFAAIAALAALSGCTTQPVPLDQSAVELVAWFNTGSQSRLSTVGNPSSHLRVRPNVMGQRCAREGGSLQERVSAQEFRDNRTKQFSGSQTLTDLMVCQANGATLWGATTVVDNAETVISGNCNGSCYYGIFRMAYLAGQEAAQELARRDVETQRAMAQADACAEWQKARREGLRSAPKVGQETSLGLVVDVRLPTVQVQLNQRERAARHRDQEWVQAAQLDLPSLACK